MRRFLAWGTRNPFFASLLLVTVVASAGVAAVAFEADRRVEDVRQEERARAAAIAANGRLVCELFAERVDATFAETYEFFREAAGSDATPFIDDLDAIRARNLDPTFCGRLAEPPPSNP